MIIIFAYIFINLLATIFLKRSNVLYCGLFGGSGILDLTKIKLLGFANDTRGGDGTGYYYNDEIKRGINSKAKFYNLVKEDGIEDAKAKVFLGHSRKSSSGGNTLENTHPFMIDNMLVLTHNGTIYNIKALCTKYEVDPGDMKVDSQILAKIILEKGFDVLNDYIGYAALAFCFRDKPNDIYLYHGLSKEKSYTAGFQRAPVEERPLYYLQTKEALYYSSMEEPLSFLKEGEQEVKELPYNCVYKIRNGKFIASWKYDVNRVETNWNLDEAKWPTTYNYPKPNTTSVLRTALPPAKIEKSADIHGSGLNVLAGHTDSTYESKHTRLFWYKGRYRITDDKCIHPIIAQRIIFADKHTGKWAFPTKTEEDNQQIEREIDGEKVTLKPYYFHDGVMIRNEGAYTALMNRLRNPSDSLAGQLKDPVLNYAQLMSRFSKYPITLAASDSVRLTENERMIWYHDGVPCNFGNQKPQFANVKLNIVGGWLKNMDFISTVYDTKENRYKEELDKSGQPILTLQDVSKLPSLLLKAIDCYIRYTHTVFEEFNVLDEKDKEKTLKDSKLKLFEEIIKNNTTLYQRMSTCPVTLIDFLEAAEESGSVQEIPLDIPSSVPAVFHDPAPEIDFQEHARIAAEQERLNNAFKTYDEVEVEEELILDDESENLVSEFIAENPLRDIAEELQAIEESDFAQEVAHFLFIENTRMLDGLRSICENHKKKELSIDIINAEKL